MVMCHMVADTLEELHDMAEMLGLKRSWFQNKRMPHYDISKSVRARAVGLGAVEISSRELVMKFSPTFNNRNSHADTD